METNVLTIHVKHESKKYPLEFQFFSQLNVFIFTFNKQGGCTKEVLESLDEFLVVVGGILKPEFSLSKWSDLSLQIKDLFLNKGVNRIEL